MRYSCLVVAIGLSGAAYASDAHAKLDAYVDKSNQRITVVRDGGGDGQPTPPARQSRSMAGKMLRSAGLGDGGFGKGAYPPLPRPAPSEAMNQSQPGADAGQRAAHRMPDQRSKPHGEISRNTEAPVRQIDAADQYATQDIYRTQERWTPGFGYQVLPKSYWTGGSWRWWNAGQQAR